jgi:hypothetical protein
MPKSWWRVRFVCGLIALLTSTPRVAAEAIDVPSVTLRVDDYASVDARQLARAQEAVSRMYATIGVQATWLKARRLSTQSSDLQSGGEVPVPDITVIVLDRSMTTRMAPPRHAVGLAAHAGSGQGRIAYVFYERLRAITTRCNVSNVTALSLVIAHETGHLLLPYGAHSDVGVMRGHWDFTPSRDLHIQQMSFTPAQGREIRQLLQH